MSRVQQVAIYKGDQLLAEGSVPHCARVLKVKQRTIHFYLTPAYQRRLAKRKSIEKSRFAVRVDDDGDQPT